MVILSCPEILRENQSFKPHSTEICMIFQLFGRSADMELFIPIGLAGFIKLENPPLDRVAVI
jgi:hypothetical protein